MRRIARGFLSPVRHQASNLLKLAGGGSLTTVPLGSKTLGLDDVELVRRWLRDRKPWTETGVICEYESAFSEWNGSGEAFSFLGGRVALSAAIYALDLKPGDEVVLPGYTCVAVPNAFRFAQIKTVFCDIELDTWGPDVASIEACLTPRTRAVVIQHLYGLVCRDYEEILALAQRRDLRVIEDCAHSTGASYCGVNVGNRGDIGFYSSEQSKVFNTSQGGIAVTNDPKLAERLAVFQRQAAYPDPARTERLLYTLLLNYYANVDPLRWLRSDFFDIMYYSKRLISTTPEEERGIRPDHYGARLPPALAAIGLNQLSKLSKLNEQRRLGARRWQAWCLNNGYVPARILPQSIPVFLRYPVMVEPEKKLDRAWATRELNVDLGVWFVSQIHPVLGEIPGCPNAVRAVRECVNFPSLL